MRLRLKVFNYTTIPFNYFCAKQRDATKKRANMIQSFFCFIVHVILEREMIKMFSLKQRM